MTGSWAPVPTMGFLELTLHHAYEATPGDDNERLHLAPHAIVAMRQRAETRGGDLVRFVELHTSSGSIYKVDHTIEEMFQKISDVVRRMAGVVSPAPHIDDDEDEVSA